MPSKNTKLNIRQQRYVEAYLKDPSNPGEAYKLAGYKCKSDLASQQGAYQLMQNPAVAHAIAQRQAKAGEETNVTMNYVRARLYTVIERCMQHVPILDALGQPTGIYEFRPMAALKGLDQLARVLGGYNDKLQVEQTHQHTHTHSLQDCGVSVSDLRAMLESLRQRKTLPPGTVVLEHKPALDPPLANG